MRPQLHPSPVLLPFSLPSSPIPQFPHRLSPFLIPPPRAVYTHSASISSSLPHIHSQITPSITLISPHQWHHLSLLTSTLTLPFHLLIHSLQDSHSAPHEKPAFVLTCSLSGTPSLPFPDLMKHCSSLLSHALGGYSSLKHSSHLPLSLTHSAI